MALSKLNVPLQNIVDSDRNVYELTNAAIKRAGQLSVTGSETVKKCEGKVVSAALTEVVNHIVEFQNDSE